MAIHNLDEEKLPENCYVFKHSTRCPVSATAAAQVRETVLSLPLFWINVVEQRKLSNWVEQAYGIEHHSPQLLKIVDGSVVKSWTHGRIRKEEIGKDNETS